MEARIIKEVYDWVAYAIGVGTGLRSSYTYELLIKGKGDEERIAINAVLRQMVEGGRIVAYKLGAVTFLELPIPEMERIKRETKTWKKSKPK